MGKRGLVVVLPTKSFRLTPTWVAEREGTMLRIWASVTDHHRGRKTVAHAQQFDSESDAKGAHHLFNEAAFYANACGDGHIDLRNFCFWDEPPEPEPESEQPEPEEPRPQGITLASLVRRKL